MSVVKDDPVLIVTRSGGRPIAAQVWYVDPDGFAAHGHTKLFFADEGVTWCRGWDGEEARAFECAHALWASA